MVRVADSAAVVAGVKVTLIVQLAPAARVAGDKGQVFVSEKSDPLAPEKEILVIVKATFAPLVRVTVWAVLLVLTVWLPKANDVGATVTAPTAEAGENLETKASCTPPKVFWKAVLEVGNVAEEEPVPPVRYILGGEAVSRAIPAPSVLPSPPQNVENTSEVPVGLNTVTKAFWPWGFA